MILHGMVVLLGLALSFQASDPADWPPWDAPDQDPWVTGLRDRVVSGDDLAAFAAEFFGPHESCRGAVTTEFDGMKFGGIRLSYPSGATLLLETMPPEISRVVLRTDAGFDDEGAARQAL
jgi:hypothetical protein